MYLFNKIITCLDEKKELLCKEWGKINGKTYEMMYTYNGKEEKEKAI